MTMSWRSCLAALPARWGCIRGFDDGVPGIVEDAALKGIAAGFVGGTHRP